MNGDGLDDLVIGSGEVPSTINSLGKSYVIFGSTTLSGAGTIELSTLEQTPRFSD